MALNYAKKSSRKSSIRGGYYYEQPQKAKKHVNDDNHDDAFTAFKKLILELFEDALQDANFVITTCYNAANDTLRTFPQPTIVIIDEAGLAIELETLMATDYDLGLVIMVMISSHHHRRDQLSHLCKLVNTDRHSLSHNNFAPQICMSLMARQIEDGMEYTMCTKQYRMTAGIEEHSSRMYNSSRLEKAVAQLLVHRQPSRDAVDFIHNKFGMTTTVPDLFVDVYMQQIGACD